MKSKKEVVIPILNDEYKVIVIWGDMKYIEKRLKAWNYDPMTDKELNLEDNRGLCLYQEYCHPFIIIPRRPKTAQEIGTLSHEAVHAITDIFTKIKQPLDGELFAHSVGAIVRGVLK